MKANTTIGNSSPILDGNWLGDTTPSKKQTGYWSLSCAACGTLLTTNTWLKWLKLKTRQKCTDCYNLNMQKDFFL